MAFRLACPEALADPEQRKSAAGAIGGYIFHTKNNFSGMISEEADRRRREDPDFNPTPEHYYSRSKCGEEIVTAIGNGASFEEVRDLIIKSCSIHYTTKEENTKLGKLKHLNYPDNYEFLGIKLVPYVKLSQKYVYIIDGVEYNSSTQAANTHNVSAATVTYRCKSNSDKYSNWIMKEVSNG